ncbi:hypothetical protein BCR44DRAFT_60589 [Catenaria anguillulae PL171]|uniref:NodB homology domain-containing protein n=1 Tax=Catenaria anguillulae PL171 TaxID=765915 RepID=A0A1Y2I1U3_9FUNG|nr:hypothetical protein BCR44DRAFT_60589 [Catenaria anguillulae PL171]
MSHDGWRNRLRPILLLLLCIQLSATAVYGTLPPVSEFCSTGAACQGPPKSALDRLGRLERETFGPGAARCGDTICDTSREETCRTCPTDCGRCTQTEPVVKCRNRNHFALTFDDGPTPGKTRALVEYLNRERIKATFFVNGNHFAENPDNVPAVKFTFNSGHLIGSHTFSHRSLGDAGTKLSYAHMRGEIIVNDEAIELAVGRRPRIVRPPFFAFNPTSMAFLETSGYTVANVNVFTDDWLIPDPNGVLKFLQDSFAKVRDNGGWIHLQHDHHPNLVQATTRIVEYLKTLRVEFVTLDVCLGVSGYRPSGDNPFLAKHLEARVWKGESATNTTASTTATASMTRVAPTTTEISGPVDVGREGPATPLPLPTAAPGSGASAAVAGNGAAGLGLVRHEIMAAIVGLVIMMMLSP